MTSLEQMTAAVAYRRLGTARWKRLDVDDSPPYRAFLDPARFKKHERLQLVAIARSLDGSTATSKVVGFRLPRALTGAGAAPSDRRPATRSRRDSVRPWPCFE